MEITNLFAWQASAKMQFIFAKTNEISLIIADNGTGDDTGKKSNGVGIRNIISRAELYNGTVTITSRPGKGYELKVILISDDL